MHQTKQARPQRPNLNLNIATGGEARDIFAIIMSALFTTTFEKVAQHPNISISINQWIC